MLTFRSIRPDHAWGLIEDWGLEQRMPAAPGHPKTHLKRLYRRVANFAEKPRGTVTALFVGLISLAIAVIGIPGAYHSNEGAFQDWAVRNSVRNPLPDRHSPDSSDPRRAPSQGNASDPATRYLFDGVQYNSQQDALGQARQVAALLSSQIRQAEQIIKEDRHEIALASPQGRSSKAGPTDAQVQAAIADLQSKDEKLSSLVGRLRKKYTLAIEYIDEHDKSV